MWFKDLNSNVVKLKVVDKLNLTGMGGPVSEKNTKTVGTRNTYKQVLLFWSEGSNHDPHAIRSPMTRVSI